MSSSFKLTSPRQQNEGSPRDYSGYRCDDSIEDNVTRNLISHHQSHELVRCPPTGQPRPQPMVLATAQMPNQRTCRRRTNDCTTPTTAPPTAGAKARLKDSSSVLATVPITIHADQLANTHHPASAMRVRRTSHCAIPTEPPKTPKSTTSRPARPATSARAPHTA
jgi:hypothetical protein